MRRTARTLGRWTAFAAVIVCCGSVTGCSEPTGLPAAELRPAVERDGVAFTAQAIPAPLLDRLAQNRVVVVGETHLIREQGELLGELLRSLHARGFRQLLLEWPHMADWLLADFVEGTGLEPGFVPPLTNVGGSVLTAVRDFNRTLPEADRIHVRAIDVNLDEYGGAPSFRNLLTALSRHLPDPAPVATFLRAAYDSPERQTAALNQLQGGLRAGETSLSASWGSRWHDVVSEMVEVELASVGIRAGRQSDYDRTAGDREDVIKRLADSRLDDYGFRTVVSAGNTHAQKSRLMGTEGVEWLGDYLAHRSPAAGGPVFVLCVTPARLVSEGASPTTLYDVMSESPGNELWRLMHEAWPDRIAFLPLDDPVFGTGGVLMNFDGTVYSGAPKAHYDALVLLPLSHRVPVQ